MADALPKSAEVVVVGAGCIGASVAVHLVMAGLRDVVMIDKEGPASMTTGRSSAIVRQHYSQPTFARWALESLGVWQRFAEIFDVPPVFTRTGWAIASGEADAEAMRSCVDVLRDIGVRTEMVSTAALRELEPAATFEDVACAAYEPDAGYCDPKAAAAGFAAAFERHGGRAVYGTRVTALRRTGDTWHIQTTAGAVETLIVVNAAGAYARELAREAGVHVPIEHQAHDVAIFSPATINIALYDLVGGVYYRPDATEAVMAGSMNWSEGARVLDDPDAFPWLANPQIVSRYQRALQHRYPKTHAEVQRSHSGIYFITPDRYPIIGEVPQQPGLFLACGFSHGFKVSPAVGRAISSSLINGPAAAPELREFRLTRFAEAQPIKPLFPYVSGVQT